MTTSEKKLINNRLSVLELAAALGNVAEACRHRGIARSQFYEYKRRFQTHGIEGLKDLPPIHHSHPMTTPDEHVTRLIELSLQNPMWGCTRLSNQLKLEGISVSAPTVQSILIKKGMGKRYERLLKLEEKAHTEKIELTGAQVQAIEKYNPCFKERRIESSMPGELLSQDTFLVGTLKRVGKVYFQVVVDTYGSYAFGYLHTGKIPEHSAAILHNDVLPQYKAWSIEVKTVLTDNGREYCGKDTNPYEIYLALNDIEHRTTRVKRPQRNGFAERFNRTVLDEFFRPVFRSKYYESVETLQTDLNKWLKFYNYERSHQGYRNMGKRPFDTTKEFIKNERKEA